MGSRTTPNLRRRARQRGAAALEATLSIMILAFVMTAGIHFGDAMIVRHRLGNAANRAARVCSIGPTAQNPAGCIAQQVNATLGDIANRCQPLAVNPGRENLGTVAAVRVEIQCQYAGGVWSGMYNRFVGQPMLLRAQAMMPAQ